MERKVSQELQLTASTSPAVAGCLYPPDLVMLPSFIRATPVTCWVLSTRLIVLMLSASCYLCFHFCLLWEFDVISPHKLIGSGISRRCGFVGVEYGFVGRSVSHCG